LRKRHLNENVDAGGTTDAVHGINSHGLWPWAGELISLCKIKCPLVAPFLRRIYFYA